MQVTEVVLNLNVVPDETVEGVNVPLIEPEVGFSPLPPVNTIPVNEALVAPLGKAPVLKLMVIPFWLAITPVTRNGEKPVEDKVTLDLGLKIPIEYNTAATITMIRIAQP